ncbi:hypothetical protein FALBO_12263 [Fusarium albosuccineum]|uniref:Uncharacterized protein n=1 Tax=Fusarium albosuccineum TaxID=1237068 RepID=A0A8H4L2R0_9HYPO|nr:hypothetical protein FALBO_12263 [Fusarium albosuccineum]
MAMDALKNLVNNVPGWLKRLDDLSGQVDRRQAELAAVAAAEGKNSETKSLRNKGSTESLKPKDDPPVVHAEAPAGEDNPEDVPAKREQTPNDTPKTHTPSPDSIMQQQEVIKAARARARAQVKKKPKSPSMMSTEDAPAAYRTRSMIIVFYDSYVQGFFDDLVRFVSSSRNLMRKAKMAARVAQIKKLAEQDVSEDGSNGDNDLPSLRYMSSRRFGPMSISRPGASDQPPDVYDNLDKGLEFVQSMCEHGAHQFLRDGDCNDEISKVQKRLTEVLEMASKEMERVQREEPELAKETGEMGKIHTRRPISMRRDISIGLKEGTPTPTGEENKLEPAKEESAKIEPAEPTGMDLSAPLAVDPDIMEADEGIDIDEIPKLQYRSTRAMRSRGP